MNQGLSGAPLLKRGYPDDFPGYMRTSRLLVVSLALALVAVPGCSKKSAEGPAKAKVAAAGWKHVEDAPEAFREKAQSFAQTFEQNIRDGETPEIRQAFDCNAIADGVCQGLTVSGSQLAQFKSGLQKGLQNGTLQLAKTWMGQEAKFKHLVIYNGELAARFRFISEKQGISITDLVLRTNSTGSVGIVNLCNHTIGYDMVEQSRRTAMPMLAELDKSFIERLVDRPDVSRDDMKRFSDMSQEANSGRYGEAIATYRSLGPSLRDSLPATSLYLMALQRSEDNIAYTDALKEAAARFKTANFQFMLVDVYAVEKNYDKAAACIDDFMGTLEKDAALMALKSLLLNAKGDVTNATTVLTEALQLEPDCAYVHAKGLDVLLAAKDYKQVHDSMVFLEKTGRYDFKGHLTGKVWRDFRQSPESAEWR